MEKEKKVFKLYETTVGELLDTAGNSHTANIHFSYTADPNRLSKEERQTQINYPYFAAQDISLFFSSSLWREKAEEAVKQTILNGTNGGLRTIVKNKIYAKKIEAYVVLIPDSGAYKLVGQVFCDDPRTDSFQQYLVDMSEFGKTMDAVLLSPYGRSSECIRFNRVMVESYPYVLASMSKVIDTVINGAVKKYSTYCMKNGENIVPKEYRDKGWIGVEEWQQLQQSKNPANSMEKKIYRELISVKMKYAEDCIRSVCRTITNATFSSCDEMCLEVDGRRNKAKVQRLRTKIFKGVTLQQLSAMSADDISEMVREYWKKTLTETLKAVSLQSFPDLKTKG